MRKVPGHWVTLLQRLVSWPRERAREGALPFLMHFVLPVLLVCAVVGTIFGPRGVLESQRKRGEYRNLVAQTAHLAKEMHRRRFAILQIDKDPVAAARLAAEESSAVAEDEVLLHYAEE